jgi:hypothetical protein
MSPPMRRPHQIAAVGMLTLLFSGCGQPSPKDAAAAHLAHQNQAKAAKAPDASSNIDPDMVSAVNLNGSSTNLFTVKFKLQSNPVLVAPVQVSIVMIPAPDVSITHMHVLFQPSEGLQLQSGRSVDLTEFTSGQPIEQQVTVVPQQTGVLSLSATVLVDTATESISRTYAIPLIASDGHS